MTFYGQADRKRFTAIEDQCTHNSCAEIVDFWTLDVFLALF